MPTAGASLAAPRSRLEGDSATPCFSSRVEPSCPRCARRLHRHGRRCTRSSRPGGVDLRRLDGQVRRLAERVAARPGLWAVATYADRGGTELFARPAIARLLCEATYRRFDVVVIDALHRLAWDARAHQELVARLAASGVRVEVVGRSRLGRAAAVVADLVLADLIGAAAR